MMELKPCPFCGGDALLVHYTIAPCRVVCEECGCGTHWFANEESDMAVAAWNRRAERTCGEWRGDPSPYAITNFEAHEDDELWCEHCDIELDEDWSYCPSCGAKVVDHGE